VSRNRLVRLAVVLLATAAVAVGWWMWRGRQGGSTAAGPIVLISIDTLRADHLPAYGYTAIRTPAIDRLAAGGVLFEHAYSHAPQTLPAHASILSGELPYEHGIRDNIGFTVKTGQRFVQSLFHAAGFATGGFVSAYVLREQTGINQGFDIYDDRLPPASPDVPLGDMQRPGARTIEAAEAWVDRQTGPKFFLFVHLYEPHTPYSPPARFSAARPYDGEIEYADELVGQLLDHLRGRGLYETATIVLLSDHGEGLGDHGEDEHGIFLYQETTRVPLVVKMPGGSGAGRRVAAPVQHIDVAPTLLDLAGVAVPPDLHGRSLRPALTGAGALVDASIYAESLSPRYHFGWSELYSLTDDRYRLIRAPRDELYDLAQDPGERTSIAADRPQVRAAMRTALDRLVANRGVAAPSAVSDEERRKLAALGYVGTQSGTPLQLPGDRLPDPKDKVPVLQKYRRAAALSSEGKYAEAEVLYRELLATDAQMTDVWLRLAESYTRRGMMAAALAAYQEVITRHPKDPAALTGAAAALVHLGRFDEARTHAELAVAVAPATAHELLARLAAQRGDAAGARREAQLAKDADPTLPMPSFVEGLMLYMHGQYSAAIPHLLETHQALAGRTEQMPDVDYLLGDSYARLEQNAEAEKYLCAELSVFPAHIRARAALAMLYRAGGRDADSDRAIADLIRASPTPEAYETAAQLWTMFGERAKAEAIRRAAPAGRGAAARVSK